MTPDKGGSASPVFPAPSRTDGYARPFWDGVAGKRLMLQYDPRADRFQFYPRPVSLFDGSADLVWREASGLGSIAAFTLVQLRPPAVSYHLAAVDLAEGPRLMAPLVDIPPEQIRIGLAVRLRWPEDRPFFAFGPAGR